MANTAFINSDQITSVASSMKTKGDNILTEYRQNCTPALNMSTECLQLSGLDTTEFFKALESIYTKLNERISEFADFLTNTVAVEYDFTSKAIAASFNEEFANEIGGLLGISVGGAGSAAGVGSAIAGTTGPSSSSPSSSSKNPSTSPSTKAPTTAAKTEPPIISNCSGYYKPVKNCSGGYSYVKVGENETVIRNCSGQLTVVNKASVPGSTKSSTSSSSTTSSSTGFKPGSAQSSYAANGSTSSNSTGSSYAANPNAGSTSSNSTSTGSNRRYVSTGSGGYWKYY